jgi:hypothetical protein
MFTRSDEFNKYCQKKSDLNVRFIKIPPDLIKELIKDPRVFSLI